MDVYEVGILFGSALSLVALGWYWKPVRPLSLAIAVLSLAGRSESTRLNSRHVATTYAAVCLKKKSLKKKN